MQGKLHSLRRIKDDVREVAAGTECGVAVEGFKDWEVGPAARGCWGLPLLGVGLQGAEPTESGSLC